MPVVTAPYTASSSAPFSMPPPFYASHGIFDEYGYPLPPPIESSSNYGDCFRPITTQELPYPSVGPFLGDEFGPPPGGGFGLRSVPPGERPWTTGPDYRLRKLKMPLFDGEDAYGWIYRIGRFFDIQGLVTTGERIRTAVLCMEGQALAWYRWSQSREPFRHWEGLKGRLLERFQPSQEGDIYQQFLAVKQVGTAREYVGLFETLAAQLAGIPEKVLEGTFINGLKPETRTAVRLLQPAGLNQAIKMTLMVDENRSMGSREQSYNVQKGVSTCLIGGQGNRSPLSGAIEGPQPMTGRVAQPFRRMTETELADKRARGLCFRCDGKFVPGHRCPDKTLKVLVIHEDEEKSDDDEELVVEGRVDTKAL